MSIPKHYLNAPTSLRNFSDVKTSIHKIEPYNASSFNDTSNRRILIKLPRVGLIQGTKSYLRADVTVAGGNCGELSSIFNRMRVKVGNQYVVDQREFGFWQSLKMTAHLKTDEAASTSVKMTGYGNATADGTKSTRYMPLAHVQWDKRSLFSNLLPLYKMDQIELEFEINDDIDQFTNGDATGITVDNIQLVCHLVDSPRLRADFAGDVKRAIECADHQVRNLNAASTKINEILPSAYQNVVSVFMVQRDTADVSVGVTYYNEYSANVLKNNSIDNCQLLLDGRPYPTLPIKKYENGVEFVKNLENSWGLAHDCLGSHHDYEDIDSTSKFYVGIPLSAERKAVSGLRTASTSANLQFKCDISNTNATQLDFFIMYNKFIHISSSGALKTSE